MQPVNVEVCDLLRNDDVFSVCGLLIPNKRVTRQPHRVEDCRVEVPEHDYRCTVAFGFVTHSVFCGPEARNISLTDWASRWWVICTENSGSLEGPSPKVQGAF